MAGQMDEWMDVYMGKMNRTPAGPSSQDFGVGG